jgi:hypothetical protein
VFEVVLASVVASGLEDRGPSSAGAWVVVGVICALGFIAIGVPFAMFGASRVVVDADGVEINNWGTERTRIAWGEISRFEVGSRWFRPPWG